MLRLSVSPDAEEDIDDIYLYGAGQYGLSAAESYLDGLRVALAFLERHPKIARERSNIRPPVRLYRYVAHHILYAVRDEDVVILRILHHSANWVDHF
jgi:toxin ParE1/3/4